MSAMKELSKRDRRRVRAEAAAWIARLHGPARTREMEEGLRRWLAEHPAHAAEFEVGTDAWNETAHIPLESARRASIDRPAGRRNRWLWRLTVGMAAGLAAVAWFAYRLGRTVVSTGVGEQETVVLADGSRITLNTNSRVILHYGQHTRNVILRYGEAYFQIVHNAARPFVVRAGNQKVIDVGTAFVVRRNGVAAGSLSVTVVEGRVAVAPVSAADIVPKVAPLKVVFVSAGNRLLLRPHALPKIQAEPAAQATAWLRGELIFNNTDLRDAATQFNRYNPIKIVIAAAQLQKIHVSGLFRIGASESFARAVAEDHHLRLIVRSREFVLEPGSKIPDVEPPPHR